MEEKLSIDQLKTALVVIDLQNGIVERNTFPYESNTVVTNASKVAEACRIKKIPVFLVRVTPSPDGKDALHPIVDNPTNIGDRPSNWATIVKEMGPKDGDFVITKHQWGAFYGTDLDLQLRRRGISTIILCGIATNMGVESTARFAFEYGYNQVFVEDAMSSLSAGDHEFAVNHILPRIGLVRKTSVVLEAL